MAAHHVILEDLLTICMAVVMATRLITNNLKKRLNHRVSLIKTNIPRNLSKTPHKWSKFETGCEPVRSFRSRLLLKGELKRQTSCFNLIVLYKTCSKLFKLSLSCIWFSSISIYRRTETPKKLSFI